MATKGKTLSYGDVFEFDINSILTEGDFNTRRGLFNWWFGEKPVFACGRCEVGFTPHLTEIVEDDEVVCPRCAGGR
jgi:DNA-directed RNA polymerase subunit RPC12/RpoP